MSETIDKLSSEAFRACQQDFAVREGRSMDGKERAVAERASYLVVQWSTTQPASRFRPKESFLSAWRDKRSERRERRMNDREERRALRDCKRYVTEHWNDGGPGFLISLISAVIFNLIVFLIVRWIVRRYFNDPETTLEVCR